MSFAKRCQLQEPFLGQGELFLLLVTSGPSVCSSLNQSMGPNNYIQQVFPRPAQSHSRVTLRNKRTAICDLAAPAGSLECSTSKFLPLVQRKFLGCPAPATFPSCWLLAPSSLIDTQRTLCHRCCSATIAASQGGHMVPLKMLLSCSLCFYLLFQG